MHAVALLNTNENQALILASFRSRRADWAKWQHSTLSDKRELLQTDCSVVSLSCATFGDSPNVTASFHVQPVSHAKRETRRIMSNALVRRGLGKKCLQEISRFSASLPRTA
jgi:hypothetical protein